jgi:hypothetical protein
MSETFWPWGKGIIGPFVFFMFVPLDELLILGFFNAHDLGGFFVVLL